jgi:hypothetical protein
MALFRRLTSFSKSKKNSEEGKASGIANGTKANGTEPNDTKTNDTKTNDTKTNDTKTNGTKTSIVSQPATAAKSNLTNGYVPATVMEEEEEQPKEDAQAVTQGDVQAVTRADVARTFEEFAQLIHASRRPLPKQSGDGAYLEKVKPDLNGHMTGLDTNIRTGGTVRILGRHAFAGRQGLGNCQAHYRGQS